MRFFRFYIPAAALFLALPALAGESTQPQRVLELFTSQGCSSCPPANKFAGKMAGDSNTLVLSYGVTYWDYLGWKDTFAKPDFTKRQRSYGRALGSANVYTPQMILNGSAHGPHYTEGDVRSMDIPSGAPDISINIERGQLVVSAQAASKPASYKAVLVEYVPGPQSVPVKRGENGGRILTVTNVVTNVKPLGTWEQTDTLETGVKPRSGKAYCVLLHDLDTLKIATAASYN